MRIDLASSTRGEEVVRWIVLTEESSLAGEKGHREDLHVGGKRISMSVAEGFYTSKPVKSPENTLAPNEALGKITKTKMTTARGKPHTHHEAIRAMHLAPMSNLRRRP
jgi:hypothetical protein